MPHVPILRPREVVHTFEKLGWEVARQRGSHIILTKKDISPHSPSLIILKLPEVHYVA